MLNKYLFNFAVTYVGGGFKRLYEYAKWFNENGGAGFIIHTNCRSLIKEFPNNHYFLPNQPKWQRIFMDCNYLNRIGREIGPPDLYYSYGIPIYARFGKINWFHLSNVLPIFSQDIPLTLFDRLNFSILGRRIKKNFQNADVISAESNFSLGLINTNKSEKLFLSVNGTNDELTYSYNKLSGRKDNIAVIIGTNRYKALHDSYQVFEMLRKSNSQLKLIIIGNKKTIPKYLLNNKNIIFTGLIKRSEFIDLLSKTRYYISTSLIENSSIATSEGIFSADESYISDIPPHRELLNNMPYDEVSIPDIKRLLLHIKRENISEINLKSWDIVIIEMLNRLQSELKNIG